jgi:surface carbohydrate biosynthesis protein
VYFHIDEFNRDAVTASALKSELKTRNIRLSYGNRFTIGIFKYFERIFDVSILPKPHFMTVYFNEAEIRSLKSSYLMLYTENIGIIANDEFPKMVLKGALDKEFMEGNTVYVDKISAFCFWGSQVANVVKRNHPKLAEKCFIVGHPRHDARCLTARNVGKKNNKSVGIITRFCTLNDYYDRGFLEKLILDSFENETRYEYKNNNTGDFLLWQRRGASVLNEICYEALDIKNTVSIISRLREADINVSIRVHPREDASVWRSIAKFEDSKIEISEPTEPFNHWAIKQEFVIGPPSTSFYDCEMIGVPTISTHNLNKERSQFVDALFEDNNKLMEYIYAPDEIDDLIKRVTNGGEEPNRNKEKYSVLKAEADFPDQTESISRLADVVELIIQRNKKPNSRKYFFGVGYLAFKTVSTIRTYREYVRRKIRNVKANSANFLLTRKNIMNIDQLCEKS